MKKLSLLFIVFVVILLLTACGGTESSSNDGQVEQMDQMDHAHVEAPDEFASLENPVAGDHEAIEAGEAIFQTNCAACHGPEGKGDGPAAEGLDPKPATLSDSMMMNTLSDGYLFWRVSKGGQVQPFNSAMPAWETTLSEMERWQVISFVRTLSGESDEHMDEGEHMDTDEHMDTGEHMDDDEHAN